MQPDLLPGLGVAERVGDGAAARVLAVRAERMGDTGLAAGFMQNGCRELNLHGRMRST